MKNEHPKYIFSLVPARHSLYWTSIMCKNLLLNTDLNFFKSSFASIITEWNNLDLLFRKSESFSVFKTNILKFIQPSSISVYKGHNHRGSCLITILSLSLDLSHLRENKFNLSFQDTINPQCSCRNYVESTKHFLLDCSQFVNKSR